MTTKRIPFSRLVRQGACLAPGLLLLCALSAAQASAKELAPLRLAGWQLQDAAQVAQPGEVVSLASYQPQSWHPAVVPGTVLTSLVQDGTYPDPFYGENNRTIPESLCRASYWYRTTFTPPAGFRGQQVWLKFNGINYRAEVWLNGHKLGNIEGAFARGIFNITPQLGETNVLAVHVFSQPNPGDAHQKSIATGAGLNGGLSSLDGPTFFSSIGWDWIPTIRDRETGLWQDVTLTATGPVTVQDPYVTSQLPLPRTDRADLTVQAIVRNTTHTAQTGILAGNIEGVRFEQKVTLAPEETRTVVFTPASTPALHLKNPRLWWPNGFGPQNLYQLHLQFSVAGAVSDAREVRFGVRQITYALPDSDNLALSVNGVPVFAKGGNWGMDEARKRISRERLEAQIRLHQLANYTLIRNWVGQSTSEDFYDLCDQYGLLVWDEFFQPNPGDGPNPQNVELYLANVREKILRYRQHCSIVLWGGRNEGAPPPNINQALKRLIDELDPTRLYQPSSTAGHGVYSHGPYQWRTPGEFYTYGTNEVFKTEIGSISVPTLEAIHAMMPARDWEVIDDAWAERDFCAGHQAGDRYPRILSNRYGPLASLADFVRKAQLANYEAFRAMYEGRLARLFWPNTALITWMSNPAQPSFVWQIYSHDLEPHASLYATRKACEPLHIQASQDNWHLFVINHRPERLEQLTAKVSIYNLDGTLQASHSEPVTAGPSAAADLGAIAFPAKLSDVHFLKLELRDRKKRLLSDNFYWRALPERANELQALNALPTVALDIQARRHDRAGACRLEVEVRNPSQSVALMAHLQLRKATSGQRVLPVFYSDNYLSLLPGETRNLTVEASVGDLAGEAPLLAVDGWNVTVAPARRTSAESVALLANTDAQACGPALPAPAHPILRNINCGGGQLGLYRFGMPSDEVWERDPLHNWRSDGEFKVENADHIELSAPNAGPRGLYQTERRGQYKYTLVGANKNCPYTVRLHFAEVELPAGQRQFNVAINGRRVLTNFDIAAEGGNRKAVVKEFFLPADEDGTFVIELSKGAAGEPKINGIQIIRGDML